MDKRLPYRSVKYSSNFSCARNWWHKFWNSFTIEEYGPGAAWCAHEIWTCSCGKRWKVDKQWIAGVIHVRAELLEEGG